MLTRKQYELLRFINERLKEAGVPPSFDEMKDALDLRSKSGIHRLITALEERGFIRRLANRARAIEVIKLPETSANPGGSRRGFTPSVIEGNLGKVRSAPSLGPDEDASFPVAVPVRIDEKSIPLTKLEPSALVISAVFSVFVPSSTWSSWSSRSKLHVPSRFTTSVNTVPLVVVAVSVSAVAPWLTV